MFEKMKAFNSEHNGVPVKVAAIVIGAVVVGGLAVAAYKTMSVAPINVEMLDAGTVASDLVEYVVSK